MTWTFCGRVTCQLTRVPTVPQTGEAAGCCLRCGSVQGSPCHVCDGTGETEYGRCRHCDGTRIERGDVYPAACCDCGATGVELVSDERGNLSCEACADATRDTEPAPAPRFVPVTRRAS